MCRSCTVQKLLYKISFSFMSCAMFYVDFNKSTQRVGDRQTLVNYRIRLLIVAWPITNVQLTIMTAVSLRRLSSMLPGRSVRHYHAMSVGDCAYRPTAWCALGLRWVIMSRMTSEWQAYTVTAACTCWLRSAQRHKVDRNRLLE